MDPISSLKAPRTDLSAEPVQARPTPKSDVSFRDVMGRSASSLARGAQSAINSLPGGPVLAAAVRGVNTSPQPHVGTVGAGPSMAAEGPSAGGASGGLEAGAGGLPGGTSGNTMETALQSSADMNLYYLQLQEAMATENRVYSAQSNVLKARHDTVKNAIGNIR